MNVKNARPYRIGKAILEAAKSLGYKEPQDPRGSNIVSGFRFPRHMIHNGVRQSTVKTYLRPVLKRKNLHVVAETHVTKIDFDKKHDRDGRLRTTGVTFQWKNGRIYHALAAREVILAAGALSTPY
uniref:Glucose-methanol-choline oxidoreductase N-terminal domain-containing protein n=1 Tax=Romanomermis culicivorax TaxID=13658 RepID=A0A915I558_ROMCU